MGKIHQLKSKQTLIEERPEGTLEEDVIWLRNDLRWPRRQIAQALGVSVWRVQQTLKSNGLGGSAA